MKEEKNDEYYLKKILKYINYIYEYYEETKRKNKNIIPNDQDSDGIIYKFLQLKEECNKLTLTFLIEHPRINYHIKLLNGFRNRLVHDYENVSYSFFIEILENDLIEFRKLIIDSLDNEI
jgi:uncharacterized protein with HEPN domain